VVPAPGAGPVLVVGSSARTQSRRVS
jgi:hypothetical protein